MLRIVKEKEIDDPSFINEVNKLIKGEIDGHQYEYLFLIHVDNWFGFKWLNYSNKELGVFGVSDKIAVVLPPFIPNRIIEEKGFKLGGEKYLETISGFEIHVFQSSTDNKNRRLEKLNKDTLFIWYSGGTNHNTDGSIMVYSVAGKSVFSKYSSYKKNGKWKLFKEKVG